MQRPDEQASFWVGCRTAGQSKDRCKALDRNRKPGWQLTHKCSPAGLLLLQSLSSVLPGLMQMGNHERAIEDYTQALQVDPQNSYAYYNRGITRDGSGDYEGAVEDFSHAIRLDPANADFFHNRGFSLRKMVWALCRLLLLQYLCKHVAARAPYDNMLSLLLEPCLGGHALSLTVASGPRCCLCVPLGPGAALAAEDIDCACLCVSREGLKKP